MVVASTFSDTPPSTANWSAVEARAPGLIGAAWAIARKDLAIELRTRSAFLSVLVFTLLGLAIFFFAWDPTAVSAIDLAPGVLWVTFTFAGLLGLQRSFGVEMQDRAIDALLVAPVDRESIYIGKLIANVIFDGRVARRRARRRDLLQPSIRTRAQRARTNRAARGHRARGGRYPLQLHDGQHAHGR